MSKIKAMHAHFNDRWSDPGKLISPNEVLEYLEKNFASEFSPSPTEESPKESEESALLQLIDELSNDKYQADSSSYTFRAIIHCIKKATKYLHLEQSKGHNNVALVDKVESDFWQAEQALMRMNVDGEDLDAAQIYDILESFKNKIIYIYKWIFTTPVESPIEGERKPAEYFIAPYLPILFDENFTNKEKQDFIVNAMKGFAAQSIIFPSQEEVEKLLSVINTSEIKEAVIRHTFRYVVERVKELNNQIKQ